MPPLTQELPSHGQRRFQTPQRNRVQLLLFFGVHEVLGQSHVMPRGRGPRPGQRRTQPVGHEVAKGVFDVVGHRRLRLDEIEERREVMVRGMREVKPVAAGQGHRHRRRFALVAFPFAGLQPKTKLTGGGKGLQTMLPFFLGGDRMNLPHGEPRGHRGMAASMTPRVRALTETMLLSQTLQLQLHEELAKGLGHGTGIRWTEGCIILGQHAVQINVRTHRGEALRETSIFGMLQ